MRVWDAFLHGGIEVNQPSRVEAPRDYPVIAPRLPRDCPTTAP